MVKIMLWLTENRKKRGTEQWGASSLVNAEMSQKTMEIGSVISTEGFITGQSSEQGGCCRWEQVSVLPWENSYLFQISHLYNGDKVVNTA